MSFLLLKLYDRDCVDGYSEFTHKLMCLFSDGHVVDDFTGAVRLGHPVPGDDWTLFCTGWLVLNAMSDTAAAFVDSLTFVRCTSDERKNKRNRRQSSENG